MNFNSWSILPAARCLFNKNKVTLKDIATIWGKGTVVVCSKPNGQLHFIAGSSGSYVEKLGTYQAVHHDQNPSNRMGGAWKVINQVSYETQADGSLKCDWMDRNMELGKGDNLDFKAGLAVFK